MVTTLYRAFDEQGRLLYVGISDGEFLRLGQHAQSAPWAVYAVTITLERYTRREDAEAAEAKAILTEDPVWNIDGRPEEPTQGETAEAEAAEGRVEVTTPAERPRLCRTADECFQAGWDDGANDEPLTQQEIDQLVALHAPYLRPKAEAAS